MSVKNTWIRDFDRSPSVESRPPAVWIWETSPSTALTLQAYGKSVSCANCMHQHTPRRNNRRNSQFRSKVRKHDVARDVTEMKVTCRGYDHVLRAERASERAGRQQCNKWITTLDRTRCRPPASYSTHICHRRRPAYSHTIGLTRCYMVRLSSTQPSALSS